MANAARQRTDNARTIDDNIKLHQRLLTLNGQEYRIITLRPGTTARFSTNYFHETWHILSDGQGAQMLARLLWGLAYCKLPRTLIVLHGEHLLPTPFDAETSDPIVLASVPETPLTAQTLSALKRCLPHMARVGRDAHTIRWNTFGLNQAMDDIGAFNGRDEQRSLYWSESGRLWCQEQMRHIGGCICYCAPPPLLRTHATWIAQLTVQAGNTEREMDYHFLAQAHSGEVQTYGEVQIFADYRVRISESAQARRDFLAQTGSSRLDTACSANPADTRRTIQLMSLAKKQRREVQRARKIESSR